MQRIRVPVLDGEIAEDVLEQARLATQKNQKAELPRPLRRALRFGRNADNNAVRRRFEKAVKGN